MGPDMTGIGKLRNVSPREAWTHEALDFTPWLCENLALLGEEIGIELEYESRETAVGSYFADIVARCPQDDRVVLIENQLERGNHQHLGQLMTYIAGTDAEIIVWIATDFSEPHLAAINQLPATDWRAEKGGDMSDAAFVSAVSDFFATNPVARASETLAECAKLKKQRMIEAAE